LRQFAAQHVVEANTLHRLQRSPQHLLASAAHPARDQSDPPMVMGEGFHQQARLPPAHGVEDDGGLGQDAHACGES